MSATPSPRALGTPKKLLFAAIALALFFVLVEGALWAVGVEPLFAQRDPFQGFSEQVRVFEHDGGRGVWRTAARAVRHSFNPQEFAETKPSGGYRVFTLGGSSAYGFPWGGNVAFTKLLGQGLTASFPSRTIEAVNAAGMSYGSHRLRIVAHEVAQHAPDAFVFYEGHNEFVERGFYRTLLDRRAEFDRYQAFLFRSRLFSVLTRAYEKVNPPQAAGEVVANRTTGEMLGLDVVREEAAQTLQAEKDRVAGLFEENVRAIAALAAQRGTTLVLCTVPSNLRDWAPNQSIFGPDVPPEARDRAQKLLDTGKAALEAKDATAAVVALGQARELAPGHAEIQYRLGRAYEESGRYDDARRAYVLARDADAQPARAISRFNEIVRKIAGETSGKGRVVLVDVERVFEENAPHGLVGFNLVEDYVHPNRQGHRLIALALWRAFLENGLLGETKTAQADVFWRAIGASPAGTAGTASTAGTAEPSPSTGAPSAEAPSAAADAKSPAELYNLALVFENQGDVDRAIQKYNEVLALDPKYLAAAVNLGILLDQKKGRPDLAVRAFQQALSVDPKHVKTLVAMGNALIAMRQLAPAQEAFRRATAADPRSSAAWNSLGMALGFGGKQDEAAEMFRRAVALEPSNYLAQSNLGSALLLQKRPGEAIAPFRAALAVKHDHAPARNGLAEALAMTGSRDEAVRLFRESLAANPGDERARAGLARMGAR